MNWTTRSFDEKYLSESELPHRDMPWHVTMLNWKTFHVMKCHQISSCVMKCHHVKFKDMIFGNISWHVMTYGDFSWQNTSFIMICHDMSWQIMKWLHLIQRGSPYPYLAQLGWPGWPWPECLLTQAVRTNGNPWEMSFWAHLCKMHDGLICKFFLSFWWGIDDQYAMQNNGGHNSSFPSLYSIWSILAEYLN